MATIAQLVAGYSLAQIAIFVIIGVGVLAIAYIVVKQSGAPIPQWVWQILGVVVLVIVGILAVKLIISVV